MQFITNLSIFLRDPLAGALVVAIVVSLVKPWIEVSIKPNNPRHDPLIRLLAILFGILLYLGVSLATNVSWGAALVVLALLNGGVIGLMSIATYHLVSGSWIPTPDGQNTAASSTTSPTTSGPAPALLARGVPAPSVDIDGIMAQATDAATATAHDVATDTATITARDVAASTATNVVEMGLQDVANQVFAMVRTALSASATPLTAPTTHTVSARVSVERTPIVDTAPPAPTVRVSRGKVTPVAPPATLSASPLPADALITSVATVPLSATPPTDKTILIEDPGLPPTDPAHD